MKKKDFTRITFWSVVLCILVGFTSLYGLSGTGTYAGETYSWEIQTVAQDFVNLAIVLPVLGAAVVMMNRGNHNGYALAWGTIAYIGYTYVIYCFNVHFNVLFLLYCAILGICVFTLLSLYRLSLTHKKEKNTDNKINIFVAIYFIAVAVLFFGLWILDIIPAIIMKTPPQKVSEAGLFTNPIHVLDLAVLLPFILFTGFSILSRVPQAIFFIPVILIFFAMMDASIGTLNIVMGRNGLSNNYPVTIIMYSLALFSLVLLFAYSRSNSKKV